MKKTLAILLSALMLVTLIAGCGGSDAAPSSSAAPAASRTGRMPSTAPQGIWSSSRKAAM